MFVFLCGFRMNENYFFFSGKVSPWTGRFYSLLDPSYAKNHIPIIASVSEHQPTSWSSFYFDLQVSQSHDKLFYFFENVKFWMKKKSSMRSISECRWDSMKLFVDRLLAISDRNDFYTLIADYFNGIWNIFWKLCVQIQFLIRLICIFGRFWYSCFQLDYTYALLS